MKNNKIISLSRNIFLISVLFLIVVLLITLAYYMYLDPNWRNTQGGLWFLIGKSLSSSYSILFAVLSLVSLIGTISVSFLTKSEFTGYIHQLPNTDKYFTGRDKLITDLEGRLARLEVNVIGIHGMGGLGKTTLIVALANRIAKKFDAEFFLDMQGHSDIPVPSDEVMLHIVRSFYPAQSNFENKSLIKGAYQSILNDKKILILLDNVRGEDQIKELAPMEGSVLLFTSRNKFSLTGSFQQELPLMSENESTELLKKITPRVSGKDAKRIAELCGYLPIALIKAGRGISHYQNLSVKEYITKLEDTRNRVGLVDSSTSLSYNLLSNQMKIAWRKLSIFQHDFGQEIASFILQTDETRV